MCVCVFFSEFRFFTFLFHFLIGLSCETINTRGNDLCSNFSNKLFVLICRIGSSEHICWAQWENAPLLGLSYFKFWWQYIKGLNGWLANKEYVHTFIVGVASVGLKFGEEKVHFFANEFEFQFDAEKMNFIRPRYQLKSNFVGVFQNPIHLDGIEMVGRYFCYYFEWTYLREKWQNTYVSPFEVRLQHQRPRVYFYYLLLAVNKIVIQKLA